MRENADQNNSEWGHFSRIVNIVLFHLPVTCAVFKPITEIILTSTIKVDILSGTFCVLGIGDKFWKWFRNKFIIVTALFNFVENRPWLTCHVVIHYFAQINFFLVVHYENVSEWLTFILLDWVLVLCFFLLKVFQWLSLNWIILIQFCVLLFKSSNKFISSSLYSFLQGKNVVLHTVKSHP